MARTDEIYVEAVERVLALAGEPGAAQQRVPACPDWTVHDVVAHVTGGSGSVWTLINIDKAGLLPERGGHA